MKHFLACQALSLVMGRKWIGTLLGECVPTQEGTGILRVRLSQFPALADENGSVRLALNAFNDNGPSGAYYPILINRASGDQFFALSSRCTHEFCVVPPFDPASAASICPCHESAFRIDGSVVAGSEATQPLSQFPISFDGVDTLCIEVPNLGYSLTGTLLETPAGSRLQIAFITRRNVRYEVRFRESLGAEGVRVPFATTEAGVASATVLTGGNNVTRSVYVDRVSERGFYSVSALVEER